MDNELSVLVEGVLREAERVGLAGTSIKYYRRCCTAVVLFCRRRGFERLTPQALEEFLAAMEQRALLGEIGSVYRSTLEKTARMMLEFDQTGTVVWRRRRPASTLGSSNDAVIAAFTKSVGEELSAGSVRLVANEACQFLRFLDVAGTGLDSVSLDDVLEFLTEVSPRHTAGMGNTVWAIKRLFAFTNQQGLTALRVEAMLARAGPRRARALPCFTPEEAGRLVGAIETDSPRGKRDKAMVWLALSTGLRCGDIVALRMDQIDWRRDEIRLVQQKTTGPLALPLSAEAGNAIADWLLHGRPACEAPEVFVRVYAPHVKLTGPTGALVMKRWLDKAGVSRQAHDGKTFHALRRTAGTRLVESGSTLELTAQVLGHRRVASSRRYIALADEALRACCLPLEEIAPIPEFAR